MSAVGLRDCREFKRGGGECVSLSKLGLNGRARNPIVIRVHELS